MVVWLVQAAMIGMQRRMAVSVRSCGICGEDLADFGMVASAADEATGQPGRGGVAGRSVQLACKHCFHPHCIRGWTIVGKKVTQRQKSSVLVTCYKWQPVFVSCEHAKPPVMTDYVCLHQDVCPTCLEKVDLRSVFAGRPWESRNLNW